ncbi:protoporphyrinogen oxidase [Streptomyces luteolus]|uniref:Coproporphyrinogen III oxidase n=1 Tax=Streptomyces luteolus TaxID=3043615 RepID=A0ABT6SN16_9ACTN|nr:protoporphyrinogen oxidase [Streptomyces sp. B-S-A12]MDI3417002.1 protoporphyrinogen oxidase [Streptomyces sp. B-S-A12]
MPEVLVLGGGIAGLTAAWQLRGRASVTVLEAAGTVGGKLSSASLAGVHVDTGAESVMALRPEAVELARAVGLGADLCDPAPAPTTLWSHGALRPLPPGHVMGIPADPRALTGTGLLSPEGLARLAREEELPAPPLAPGADLSVAGYLTDRLGAEAVDRLVEPLLGGVYAGRPEHLSLRAALPRLAALAAQGGSLLAALRAGRTGRAPGAAAVQGICGGTVRLPGAVAAASGARVRTSARARALRRTPAGRWQVAADTADGPLLLEADAVVLALPAYAAAGLLRAHSPAAAEDLGAVEHADSAVVTLAFDPSRTPDLPRGNGFLVPAVEGRAVKAATFLSAKWPWRTERHPDLRVVRVSLGRYGERHRLAVPDRELARTALSELRLATGLTGTPVASLVTRWERGLPQYGVGHVDRVARIREAVGKLPGLTVCGAAYDGVGVAACVASGRRAAQEL